MHIKNSRNHPFVEKLKQTYIQFSNRLPAIVQLTRLDKPIGIYLLLWPTLGGLWIAAQGWPKPHLLFIFVMGTVIVRSAGCCINDFLDRNLDGEVARTQSRVLVTGALKRQEALYIFAILALLGFVLVLFTNKLTIALSVPAILIVMVYPLMKRYTSLPQIVLGIAFSMGILMAFSAQTGEIPLPAYLLFVANCLWTIAYDTQYAMVDREYDINLGVKSTAILFGDADRVMIGMLQGLFLMAMVLAGRQFFLGFWFYTSLGLSALLFLYQHYLIRYREPQKCFDAFVNNNWVGATIFIGIFLHFVTK